mmetsp:Transcript_32080/g.37710  ORF Transcript_32080/g.37710 Transcript_32080/m.37710 type:complete len:313 (+) Transcript_32080:92-1030(+)
MWSSFVTTWNSTIQRRPQLVLATFLSSQSLSWLGLFVSFSALPIGVLPPELAVGMMVSKITKKFRQPANLALAAGVVNVVPGITALKITPLLTGVVADKETSTEFANKRQSFEKAYPFMKSGISRAESAANWLQGPVDKYGLALYLSGRVTGVATLLSMTALAQHGVDLPALLASYGLEGSPLSASIASLAAASAANSFMTPVHFAAATYGTTSIEKLAESVSAQANMDELKAKHRKNPDFEETQYGEEYEEMLRKEMEDSVLAGASLMLLGVSVVTSVYAMKVMGGAGLDSYNSLPDVVDVNREDPPSIQK